MSKAIHTGISIGLFFLGIGIVIGICEWVGVTFIITGFVWTALSFIPNPLRKRFWIDDKVVVTVDDIQLGSYQTKGFPKELGDRILRVGTNINSIHEIKIEKIKLKLRNNFIEPYEPRGYYLYFGISPKIHVGKYKASVRVYTTEGFSTSKSFQVEISPLS
jgi:hypothetical protein